MHGGVALDHIDFFAVGVGYVINCLLAVGAAQTKVPVSFTDAGLTLFAVSNLDDDAVEGELGELSATVRLCCGRRLSMAPAT